MPGNPLLVHKLLEAGVNTKNDVAPAAGLVYQLQWHIVRKDIESE